MFFMAVACNLFVFFDARYENRPAGPWPKHMHICLGMEPNRVHTNFTMNRVEPKRVQPKVHHEHNRGEAKARPTQFSMGWNQNTSKPAFHRGIFAAFLHLHRSISPMRKARSWHCWPTFYRGLQPIRIAQPSPFLLPFTGVRPTCTAHPQ